VVVAVGVVLVSSNVVVVGIADVAVVAATVVVNCTLVLAVEMAGASLVVEIIVVGVVSRTPVVVGLAAIFTKGVVVV